VVKILGWFSNTFGTKKSRDAPPIESGRVSSTGSYNTTLSPYRSRTANLLDELRRIPDEANAIEFITKKTPDASMGLWNFVRLANQGHQMKFYGVNTRNKNVELTDIEDEWRSFATRINSISNQGLDGLIDIFHSNGIRYGLQMCEVEVSMDLKDVVEVHPIDPRTVTWELEEREGKKVWIPYQMSIKGKIDLSKGNIFAVPLDPDGNDPRGNLIMAPALQAVDSQLQVFNDVHAVLHHQGYQRDFYSISLERLMTYCPAHIKSDSVKLQVWMKEQYNNVRDTLKAIHPDSDIVSFDDVTRNQGQGSGNNVSRSVDFRAINELTDIQTLNGLKQLGTFANRHAGRTETFSTVEMKIFVQGILSLQRGSKRLMEEIARIWLRVKGIQAIPAFTHNVVDWESELDKETVASFKQKRYAIAVLMGWIDNDEAAREVMKAKKAVGTPSENIRVSFSSGGDGNAGNDEHKGTELRGTKEIL
jgi:hypothetical protein